MPGLLVIAIAVSFKEYRESDAAGAYIQPALTAASEKPRGGGSDARCPSAHKAVAHYRSRIAHWERKMGVSRETKRPSTKWQRCPRYLARVLKRQAELARKRYGLWRWFHYAWWDWLPANWAALGACETGYGKRPGNWYHDSGTYVSAFGLYRPNYQNGAVRTHTRPWRSGGPYPTPREQYIVALSHYRVYGDGWGCPGP